MLNIKVLALLFVTALAVNTVQAAEIIYKWKDSKGNIKYTQSKPPSGIDYTTIRNRTSNKNSITPQVIPNKSEAKFNEQDGTIAAQNAEKSRVDAINADRVAKNCTIAKNNLEALEKTTRIQIEDKGERRRLTDEERTNRLQQAKENIAKYCK